MKRQHRVPPSRALPPDPEARTVTLRLPDPPLVPDTATPAPVAGQGVQSLSIVVRADGSRQVAADGLLLYRFSGVCS